MTHDVLYDLVMCLLFLVVQVSWVLYSGYQVIPRAEWPECGIQHPLSSKAFVAGYNGNFIIFLTHEQALTKQNAFKKAMLFHNLMKVYWSCIILMLNTFLD
jgi:hypothetical protein